MVADGVHQGRSYSVSVVEVSPGQYAVDWVTADGARSSGLGPKFPSSDDALAAGTAIAMQIIDLWSMAVSFNSASVRRRIAR